MKNKKEYNIAYIDGQNLHLGTKAARWKMDFNKFRIYLKDKFQVEEAYYFLGFHNTEETLLYNDLQKAGFILVFRKHTEFLKGKKKGNVDVDMVFEMMRRIVDEDDFDKIVLVSGDGDYIQPVRWLIEKGRLKKMLFPNRKYSSLYKQIQPLYGINISLKDIRWKFEYKKKMRKNKQKHKKSGRKRQ